MSEDFENLTWLAHYLVGIHHLPASMLPRGIDVCDTSAFLIGDAPVLTENLYDLVELIRRTSVFMYGYPPTDDQTNSYFVTIKAVLHTVKECTNNLLESIRFTQNLHPHPLVDSALEKLQFMLSTL
jgi:hypothetical protein